jgi:hypothetical protein
MVPAKPLPMEVPCTSTFWPAANSSRWQPPRYRLVLASGFGDAEFLDDFTGFDTGFGQVAGFGLGHAGSRR